MRIPWKEDIYNNIQYNENVLSQWVSETLSEASTTKAYLGRYQTSMNELFCENS